MVRKLISLGIGALFGGIAYMFILPDLLYAAAGAFVGVSFSWPWKTGRIDERARSLAYDTTSTSGGSYTGPTRWPGETSSTAGGWDTGSTAGGGDTGSAGGSSDSRSDGSS